MENTKVNNTELMSDDEIRILGGSEWKDKPATPVGKNWSWLRWGIPLIICLSIAAAMYIMYRWYTFRNPSFEYPISETQEQAIGALQKGYASSDSSGVTLKIDSINNVPMKIYSLSGLKASLERGISFQNDSDVYFMSRTADYYLDSHKHGHIIGDYIVKGKQIGVPGHRRAGYVAILGNNIHIGIAPMDDFMTFVKRELGMAGDNDDICSYVKNNKGSFFRQFALVSAGQICISQFELKGKVSRCAYAVKDSHLYFIETQNNESLYDFAEALVDYGFIDAVYITGGRQQDCFYRESNGTAHGKYTDDKEHLMIVFRANH